MALAYKRRINRQRISVNYFSFNFICFFVQNFIQRNFGSDWRTFHKYRRQKYISVWPNFLKFNCAREKKFLLHIKNYSFAKEQTIIEAIKIDSVDIIIHSNNFNWSEKWECLAVFGPLEQFPSLFVFQSFRDLTILWRFASFCSFHIETKKKNEFLHQKIICYSSSVLEISQNGRPAARIPMRAIKFIVLNSTKWWEKDQKPSAHSLSFRHCSVAISSATKLAKWQARRWNVKNDEIFHFFFVCLFSFYKRNDRRNNRNRH